MIAVRARLAGVPDEVVARAKVILGSLEKERKIKGEPVRTAGGEDSAENPRVQLYHAGVLYADLYCCAGHGHPRLHGAAVLGGGIYD